ncbi:hypothetical protein VB773_01845 [Haloarculaceae archaeon H-GB2-1]|nr:hypothetical protein [Haloarculaceae archaeon H-GB11]MEA5406446.1 hypothetical protein [Haloarculaceae archaeon H-GB2-1]
MTIIAKVYFSHPDMALANVIMTLPDLEFRVLQEVSTDPEHDQYFIVVETDDVEGLEEALDGDHTVASAQRMSEYDDQLVYGIEFAPQAILLASRVTSEGDSRWRHIDTTRAGSNAGSFPTGSRCGRSGSSPRTRSSRWTFGSCIASRTRTASIRGR